MISSLMMHIYSEIATGMTMYTVDDIEEIIRQYLEGFVDDAANYTNNRNYDDHDVNLLRHNLQEDGKKWAKLLEASGGKLEMTKTFYYLLSWEWDKYGNPTPQSIAQQPNNHIRINLRPDGEVPQYIEQRKVFNSHKTLGVFKTLCGNENDQIYHLKNKSDNMATRLFAGQINRRQAQIAYSCHYIPAILYSLTGTTIGETSLYKV
jgi:hypothetical protein